MKTDSWVTNQLLGWNRAEFKNCLLPKECEFVDYSSGKLWRWNNENLMILCPHKKWTRSVRFDWVVLRCKMLASHLNFGRTRIEFCCNVFHKMAQVFTRWLRGIKLFSGKWLFQPPRCFPPFAGNWRCIQRCTSSLPFPCWLPQALELHLKIWNTLNWIKTFWSDHSFRFVAGDPVNIHSDESLCVLPAGGRNHSSDLPRCTSARQIFDICHDISFIKVLTTHWEAVYLKLKFFQYLRNRSGAKRSFPVSANSQNGALGQTGKFKSRQTRQISFSKIFWNSSCD